MIGHRRWLLRGALLLTLAGCMPSHIVPAARGPAPAPGSPPPNSADQEFANRITFMTQQIVDTSAVALRRGSSPAFRALVEQLKATHAGFADDVAGLAGTRGMGIPAGQDAALTARIKALESRRNGFEPAWLDTAADALTRGIDACRSEIETGSDPAFVALARRIQPVLEAQQATIGTTGRA